MSEVYYWCINAINCTGQNMSDNLLLAFGEADANMYLCSKELRPGITTFNLYSLYTCCENIFLCSKKFSFGEIVDFYSIHMSNMRINNIMNRFVVISDGTGWACVSEYGEDIMKQCANTTWPANATYTWNTDSCG